MRRKNYYDSNRDMILEKARNPTVEQKEHRKIARRKQWLKSREDLLIQMKEPFSCSICGGCYIRIHKNRHERSKKHLAALSLRRDSDLKTNSHRYIKGSFETC